MPKIPNLPERTGLTGDENVIIETGGIVQRGRLGAMVGALIDGVVSGIGAIIQLVANEVEVQGNALGDSLAPPPARTYMRNGVFPIVDQNGDSLLWVDMFGRIGAQEFVSGPNPEPVTVSDGKAIIRRDRDGEVLEWYDYREGRLRVPGDLWDRPETSIAGARFSVMAGADVVAIVGPDGALMDPASGSSPVAFVKDVDDGGGSIAQVHVATGTAVFRLTSAPVHCHAPRFIAPGLIKYARDDGVIASVRAVLDEGVSATSIEHYAVHGQSLAGGSSNVAYPVTAPFPPDPNVLMFNGGVRAAFGDAAYNPANFLSFTPASEVFAGTRGDTGRTAFGFAMKRARRAQILVTSSGDGGAPFDEIGPGTLIWDNLLYGVERGKVLADAASKSFTVPAVHWRHGESNASTNAAGYADMLDQAISAIQTDIPAITGQSVPPILTMQQINHTILVGGVYTIFGPGDAQGIVGLTDPRAILCCPQYLGEYIDIYHMTSRGYARIDAYAAKATRRHLYEGWSWKPLHMAAAQHSGRKIIVTIAGGMIDRGGAITIDTRLVSDPGQFGFAYRDSANSATIVSVEVVGRNQLCLWLSAIPTGSSPEVGAAYWATWASSAPAQGPTTGLRTCIRDNDPECCPFTGFPLHNYLISQKIGVSA